MGWFIKGGTIEEEPKVIIEEVTDPVEIAKDREQQKSSNGTAIGFRIIGLNCCLPWAWVIVPMRHRWMPLMMSATSVLPRRQHADRESTARKEAL
jgi:hypothetical protein